MMNLLNFRLCGKYCLGSLLLAYFFQHGNFQNAHANNLCYYL